MPPAIDWGTLVLAISEARSPTVLEIVTRWVVLCSTLLLAGGILAHHLVLLPSRTALPDSQAAALIHRANRRLGFIVLVAGVTLVLATGADLAYLYGRVVMVARLTGGGGATIAVGPFLRSLPGEAALLRVAAVVALIILRLSPRAAAEETAAGDEGVRMYTAPDIPVVGALLLGVSLGGHAVAHGIWTVVVDWFHLFAASVWIGGHAYFVMVVYPQGRLLGEELWAALAGSVVSGVNRVTSTAVAVLFGTGAISAVAHVHDWDLVLGTGYGRVLAGKIMFLLPIVALGAWNRFRLRPRIERAAAAGSQGPGEGAVARAQLAVSMMTETLLALVVILGAATLTLIPVAHRAASQPAVGEVTLAGEASGLALRLRIAPYQVAESTFEVSVQENGRPVSDARVELTFTPVEGQGPKSHAEASPQGDGRYAVRGRYLTAAALWMIEAQVRRAGRPSVRYAFPVVPVYDVSTVRATTDPGAVALLQQMDRAMNLLRSLRVRQQFTDGRGDFTLAELEFSAPDRYRQRVVGGRETVAVGNTIYRQRAGGWNVETQAHAFTWPDFRYARAAASAQLGHRDAVDGEPCRVVIVTFKVPISQVRGRHALWISERTHRLRREAMVGFGNHLVMTYYDFDAPLRIEPPQ